MSRLFYFPGLVDAVVVFPLYLFFSNIGLQFYLAFFLSFMRVVFVFIFFWRSIILSYNSLVYDLILLFVSLIYFFAIKSDGFPAFFLLYMGGGSAAVLGSVIFIKVGRLDK